MRGQELIYAAVPINGALAKTSSPASLLACAPTIFIFGLNQRFRLGIRLAEWLGLGLCLKSHYMMNNLRNKHSL
jgi:hypothetical protein